jgi:hypothetical protein
MEERDEPIQDASSPTESTRWVATSIVEEGAGSGRLACSLASPYGRCRTGFSAVRSHVGHGSTRPRPAAVEIRRTGESVARGELPAGRVDAPGGGTPPDPEWIKSGESLGVPLLQSDPWTAAFLRLLMEKPGTSGNRNTTISRRIRTPFGLRARHPAESRGVQERDLQAPRLDK